MINSMAVRMTKTLWMWINSIALRMTKTLWMWNNSVALRMTKTLWMWINSVAHRMTKTLWINPTVLIITKTLWSFGHSECNRVNHDTYLRFLKTIKFFFIFYYSFLKVSQYQGNYSNCGKRRPTFCVLM